MERTAGCDLGKSAAKFSILRRDGSGRLEIESTRIVEHRGQALDAFRAWYREEDVAACASLGATGLHAGDLAFPARRYPIDACQEASLEEIPDLPPTLNLVSLGARGYGVLSREPLPGSNVPSRFLYRYAQNEKCSSGTGENVLKIATRFGLGLDEADALALSAKAAIPITARCSVFAKTEMTHFANQGRPADDLFRGYFESVARSAAALVARNRNAGPVYLIGGGTRILSFLAAFERALGGEARVLDSPLVFEARGAAVLALEDPRDRAPLPARAEDLLAPRSGRFRALLPARGSADRVTRQPPPDGAGVVRAGAVLGLDLGSTGAKAVLTAIDSGAPLYDVYDRTNGNPAGAARRLVEAVLAAGPWEVRAVGFTGSGREVAATLFRAVYGDSGRFVVTNEIVAHAAAARHADPDRGRDLSVIEIGGQDAKYIRLREGKIVEADLNQACSAGTGSFLEEQGAIYGVGSVEEFSRLAAEASRPPDLGQMCTVYVADAASEALKDGFTLPDVFAGFQFSVVHNYLDRVMGPRTLGARVFFQGKPASSPSLAWTLAAVTGREITVPANPGAMGAWGIGLSVLDQLGAESLRAAPGIDLGELRRAELVGRSEFRCRARGCGTLCPIERTEIRVGQERRVALSGGACPLHEESAGGAPKLPREAPDPFAERRAALARLVPAAPGAQVAVPVAGHVAEHLPWLANLLGALGVPVSVLEPRSGALAQGELLCHSFDSCGPAKIAHALCDVEVPCLFFPKILDFAGGQACVTQQAMPEVVEQGLRARSRRTLVVRPVLSFARPSPERAAAVVRALVRAGFRSPTRAEIRRAIEEADRAQGDFDEERSRIGREAGAFARERGIPIVLVIGPLHVIHDPAIHATIPDLVRRSGALAIPVDCFSVPESVARQERLYWGDANRAARAAIHARELGDVFPLVLSSFKCGPASFTEPVLEELLAGYPHTVLESDGHGGAAGFVTRIQAFLHSARQHARSGEDAGKASRTALAHADRSARRIRFLDPAARYVFFSGPEYMGEAFASVYRSHGYDAVAAPPLSEENLRLGRRDCSGKECLSYQMVWGAFRRYLEDHPPEGDVRFVQVGGPMCRGGVFAVHDRINLARLGLGDRVTVQLLKIAGRPLQSLRLWAALSALDLVRQLALYHLVSDRDAARALYRSRSEAVLALAAERTPEGRAGLVVARRQWRELSALLAGAARDFEAIAPRGPAEADRRTVFLSGDLLTKGNEFANGSLPDALARQGIRCILEPTADFFEFLAIDHEDQFFGRGAGLVAKALHRLLMSRTRAGLYRIVRRRHPWLPMPSVRADLAVAERVIDRSTNGGAVYAVGSALHRWETCPLDGVVVTACWGCDNTLIEESLLRHRRGLPLLFHYDDATPLDERRIESFAHRLRKRPRPPGRKR